MSNIAVASFRWLDALEKEFDKSFVDLENLFNNLQVETDAGDLNEELVSETIESAREKLRVMTSSWAQLVHKSQTIFQTNCKLEAQLVNLRSDLAEARGFRQASQKELEKLMIELHTSQLQAQKNKSQLTTSTNNAHTNSSTTTTTPAATTSPPTGGVSDSAQSDVELIQKRLEDELQRRFNASNDHYMLSIVQASLDEFKKENESLREQLVNLNSEVFGARLAAKYLDKELAGRIQQIQLFGKNLKAEDHERLWNQLEGEIHLHRHKTVMAACRNKRHASLTSVNAQQQQNSVNGESATNSDDRHLADSVISVNMKNDDIASLKRNHLIGKVRLISLKRKDPKEGLGISITGGREHGVPILISDVHDNGPAARSGNLFVGDAILGANGIDLKDVLHSEAVEILSNLTDEINLHVIFVSQEEDSDFEINSVNDLTFPFIENGNRPAIEQTNAFSEKKVPVIADSKANGEENKLVISNSSSLSNLSSGVAAINSKVDLEKAKLLMQNQLDNLSVQSEQVPVSKEKLKPTTSNMSK